MIKKIIMCLMLSVTLMGCSKNDKGQDIEKVKTIISNSEYQIYHSGAAANPRFGFLWTIHDKPNFEQIAFIASIKDNKVFNIKMSYFQKARMIYEQKIIYSIDDETINNDAKEKATELLEKNKLSIIDLYNYSEYCLNNDYYKDFTN